MVRVHEHLIFPHDSFKHPGDQKMNSKAIVVKEVLKYLQYFMSYLLSLQMLSSESERMRQITHKGGNVINSPFQTTAGGKKIGCESRISILCSSEISI